MFNHLITPSRFASCYKWLKFPALAGAIALLIAGLYFALVSSPPDYQQGEAVRMMYVHVPSAWLALMIYGVLTSCAISYLVWKNPLSDMLAQAVAPIGAAFALITLITGSLWGKPMWGTYWVWDARLTSMLILFLLYLGYIAINDMQTNSVRVAKIRSYIALLGAFNLPIIKFSVEWWNTLHQPASILRSGGSAIAQPMLAPLFTLFGAFICLSLWLVLIRMQTLLIRKKNLRKQALHTAKPAYSAKP